MAAAVCLSVSGTSRMLMRCVAPGRDVSLRLVGPAVGTSVLRRRYHVSCVSQGLKLCGFVCGFVLNRTCLSAKTGL